MLSSETPEALDQAIQTFDSIIQNKEAPLQWRNQASVRKGKCLERAGKTNTALEVYYDVVRAGPLSSPGAPPEFLWLYRSGFEAIRLLESQEDWKGAIGIAEKLSEYGGSRSQEAFDLATRLRLQHFVWDE